MAKLNIDISGIYGLAPNFAGDANTAQGVGTTGRPYMRYLGSKGQMAQGTWNPFRNFGYLCPPTSASLSSLPIYYNNATYVQNGEWTATLYDSPGTNGQNGLGPIAATKDTIFWRYSSNGGLEFGNALKLTTNTPIVTDLEAYQVNGSRYIFASYKENTGSTGDICILKAEGTSSNQTWLSATVSGAFGLGNNPHVMVAADNNYLYILDGSSIHKIDGTTAGGTNGTAYPNLLTFPPDFTLRDAVDWQGYLWIALNTYQTVGSMQSDQDLYNERQVGVYVWDRQSITVNQQKYIPIPGMRNIIKIYVTPQGEVRVLGISSDRLVHIRRYNGSTFELIEQLPIWALPLYRDSFTILEGLATWLGCDGKFYAHGKLPSTQSGSIFYTPDQTFVFGDMSSLPNTDFSPGAILAYGGGPAGTSGSFNTPPNSMPSILFSYAAGSTYKTYWWWINGTGTLTNGTLSAPQTQYADPGNVYPLVLRLPGLANVNYVRVWHAPLGSGGSSTMGTLSILKNQSSTALTNGDIAITQTDVQRGYKYIPLGDKGSGTFALQFKVSWPTNVNLSDATDWQPYAIEVDYDEDTKLK